VAVPFKLSETDMPTPARRHCARPLCILDEPPASPDMPSSPDCRPLELPVVGELVGKLMAKQAMERTLRKSFAHGERVTAELVEEDWAPLSRRSAARPCGCSSAASTTH
jgi:hypothetical protein